MKESCLSVVEVVEADLGRLGGLATIFSRRDRF